MTSVESHEVEFDHHRQGFNDDPFPLFAELRETCPVAHSSSHDGFWIVSRYRDIDDVLHRPREFSSQYVAVPRIFGIGDLRFPPLNLDPPDHGPVKKVVASAFLPAKVAALEPRVRAVIVDCIDQFLSHDEWDVSVDFARTVPLRTMALLLDLPEHDFDKFAHWVRMMIDLAANPDEAVTAGFELMEYFGALLVQRQETPGDDLMSMLIAADIDGRKLSEEEVLLAGIQLLLAGIDTTWSTLSTTFLHLAQHPEHQTLLRDQPSLMPAAIEEFLRAFGPVSVARVATVATEIAGCPISAGEMVLVPLPAANRDPAVFDRPDEVDFDRPQNKHLAFGAGIHRCIGATVARMEMSVALEEFLQRVPAFRLDESREIEWSTGQVRGPRRLPIAPADL
jgi:cytochrome P450